MDARVSARLRWDKVLSDVPIEVKPAGSGAVELRGSVCDLTHRRRAVELAETTAGVERVVDGLDVAK